MSQELILVAASGLARETIEAVNAAGQCKVIGVLDDEPARHGGSVVGVPVLGAVSEVADHPQADVIVCAGKGSVRESIVTRLTAFGIDSTRYATVVHPSVLIPASCVIGVGSVVLAGCVMTADIRVGDHVVLMPNVTLTHDDVIGDYATLCAGVALGGSVQIGRRAYLGMNSSVREDVEVGADCVLGMGSVLLSDGVPGQTLIGSPARPAHERQSAVRA